MNIKKSPLAFLILGVGILAFVGCSNPIKKVFHRSPCGEGSGNILDEAQCVGRMAESFPAADEDYFADMDYGATKDPAKMAAQLDPYLPGISPEDAKKAVVKGRNNWIVWTGGTDKLWDVFASKSAGVTDLLKTVSTHPSLDYDRNNRWQYLGLVNEPCFESSSAPRQDRHGLWLDVRQQDCVPDPFENETKYPGVEIGARGKTIEVGSYYGYASGIVGLRLFPNPDFDEKAKNEWDPVRYYEDPSYYNQKNLVRPYRVGMTCGFCHVGPNPSNPPADPEHPKWENLNSNPGAQYFWVDRIINWKVDKSSFPYQLFHTSRPGALDTSFASTDYINNPRTMNAVYSFGSRMVMAKKLHKETMTGGELNNAHLNDYVPEGSPLTQFYQDPNKVWTPLVLKDGSDSVGALGALNRVFINIGLFSEEWLEHFKPFVGGKPFTPIEIAVADKNSAYWNATKNQTPDTALFFLATAQPDLLKNAPDGAKYLSTDKGQLAKGKEVFGETCARCHSSKLPEKTFSFFPDNGCSGKNYLSCWNDYWDWTKTIEFKTEMNKIVMKDDFVDKNYLSNELRVPVSLLETNACSPLATNALDGDIWDNFSAQSYKDLPSVGKIMVHHPKTGEPREYDMPAGGRGYTRVASLISAWSTAPFLLNNSVGDFYWSGSVEDRMKSFDDSIEKMLWPEKRKGDRKYATLSGKDVPGVIDVTTAESYLRVPKGFLPKFLKPLLGPLSYTSSWLVGEEGIELGPIPKGTPVNLLSNMDLEQRIEILKVLRKAKRGFRSLPEGATNEQAHAVFADLVDPMLKVSKCPDFVVNRGHYFGTDYLKGEAGLSDGDKFALVEFLKTL